MSNIEPETLRKLHKDFDRLLDEYGIIPKSVNIKIYIGNKQFVNAKDNFPKSIHSDLVVLEKGDDWVVELLRWPYLENNDSHS